MSNAKPTPTAIVSIPVATDEILDAFEGLIARRAKTEGQIVTKAEAIARVEDKAVAERAAGYTEEAIVNRLAALQLEFGAAVAGLAETVGVEVTRLDEVQRAIRVSTQQLAELGQVAVAAEAVAIRAAARAADARRFDARASAETTALDEEIAETRAAWAQEDESFAADQAERLATRTKTRRRDEADFEYETARGRTLADDQFAEKKRDLERALAEEAESREKAFAAREEALADKADEITRLRELVENQPAVIERRTKAAKDAAIANTRAAAELDAQLAAAEAEATLEMQTLQIEALEATITRQREELADLQRQLSEGLARTQGLAAQAVDRART